MRGSSELTCEVCEAKFRIFNAWLRSGKAGKFCSKNCQIVGRKKKPKIMLEYVCKECGKLCSRRKGAGGTMEYCSIQCMAAVRGRKMAGANHPKWKGGIVERTWAVRKAIQKAKQLSGKCVRCEATDNLHGHHKLAHSTHPLFKEDWQNIEILCSRCHADEHKKIGKLIRSRGQLWQKKSIG